MLAAMTLLHSLGWNSDSQRAEERRPIRYEPIVL